MVTCSSALHVGRLCRRERCKCNLLFFVRIAHCALIVLASITKQCWLVFHSETAEQLPSHAG